jgi:hypothetical protein
MIAYQLGDMFGSIHYSTDSMAAKLVYHSLHGNNNNNNKNNIRDLDGSMIWFTRRTNLIYSSSDVNNANLYHNNCSHLRFIC